MESSFFDWASEINNWSIIGSNHTESIPADKFKRACYAEFLTNYLSTEGENRSYVLNLNAEWGAGKTWFIKRWYHTVKDIHPSVYIDVWQQDFSNDPLLTVVSSIIDQLKNLSGDIPNIPPAFSKKLFKLLKSTGKIVARTALKSIHVDMDDIDLSIKDDDVNNIVDILFTSHKEQHEAIQEIKKDILEWIKSCRGKKQLKLPAFIFIDELDRCRPSYAVEMLETIKHIFDIPGIVFVVATDTEQLQHAIKAIYGNDFDARSYLSRFFRRRFSLNSISRFDFVEDHFQKLPYTLPLESYWPTTSQDGNYYSQSVEIIAVTSDIFNLSLRQTEQLIDKLTAIILSAKKNESKINLVLLTFLCAIHDKYHDIYLNIIDNKPLLNQVGRPYDIASWLSQFNIKEISIELRPKQVLGDKIRPHYDESRSFDSDEMVRNPFADGSFKLAYDTLISSLLSLHHSRVDPSVLHDEIFRYASSLSSRRGAFNSMTPTLIRYELINSCTTLSFYKSLVELATNLD